jgi:predicted ATPase
VPEHLRCVVDMLLEKDPAHRFQTANQVVSALTNPSEAIALWAKLSSEARSLEDIASTVAGVLDVSLGKTDPVSQLGNAIAGRGRCLMILDNFEQLTAHAEATLGRWMERAPDAGFMVTSQERLRLKGEDVLALDPLPLDTAAVELFEVRAKSHMLSFSVTEENTPAVRELVRLLDGLPLAIELAAARIRVLSLAQLVERLKDRFKVLARAGGAEGRQATLRAAIDWCGCPLFRPTATLSGRPQGAPPLQE